MYQAPDGTTYGGDRQQRADGSFDPMIPDKPSKEHKWSGTSWDLIPAEKWVELGIEFRDPGKPLYASVFAKIMDAEKNQSGSISNLVSLPPATLTANQRRTLASSTVRDHWNNFKLLISSPDIRNLQSLILGIQHLKNLLNDAGFPLSQTDIIGWNQLITKADFPNSCKL